jgi:hypothetical protein
MSSCPTASQVIGGVGAAPDRQLSGRTAHEHVLCLKRVSDGDILMVGIDPNILGKHYREELGY